MHPHTALTEQEILLASKIVRSKHEAGTKLRFKGISLLEPMKHEMRKYDQESVTPHRKAWVNYYLVGTPTFLEVIVDLTQKVIEKVTEVPAAFHGPVDDEEVLEVEKMVMADPAVKEELKKLQLPPDAVVVCDPWIWGADGVADDVRQYQCYLYMRPYKHSSEPDSNHYAHPLSFSPVFDTVTQKITRIENLPPGADSTTRPTEPLRLTEPNEYIPEAQTLRTDLKELRVIQPQGASFQLHGDLVSWQKWKMRLTSNYREGMVLHQVSYDDRPLFYRVSLSDMSVPYGDPRAPFHKKQAFDLGDAGAGMMANDLQLGCDCLGAIAYKDGLIADEQGRPVYKRNAVCIHEQDAGILWKHTNYRTNRAAVVRRRELVIQSIITVSNYEYILAFIFDQAGQMEYEVRATGILSTQPIDPGVSVPWGTVVHDGVLAAYHQHILSLRVDPELDGDVRNRLLFEETSPVPRDPSTNPHGNGYISQRTLVSTTGGYDLDSRRNRFFLIDNARRQNPVNGKNISYKLHVPAVQPLLAEENSFHYKRADFADHSVYVTKYTDGELYAGGQYTNQNKVSTGVRKWAGRGDDISDENIVLWVQFGLQHVPRVEDFPVMPAETVKVAFKPYNFFDKNPAIDVPPSTQQANQSVLIRPKAEGNAEVNAGGKRDCCKL